MQAAELIQLIREAIDAAALRWLAHRQLLFGAQHARTARNRAVDDPIALRQMAAAARSAPQDNGEHHG